MPAIKKTQQLRKTVQQRTAEGVVEVHTSKKYARTFTSD